MLNTGYERLPVVDSWLIGKRLLVVALKSKTIAEGASRAVHWGDGAQARLRNA